MGSEARTMSELRAHLIEKASTDEAFRARLFADPNAAIEEELNLKVPPGFTIEVHEDVADTSHLVLPPLARVREAELEKASAGRPRHIWNVP